MNSIALASMTSPPLLMTNSTKNGLGLVRIKLMKFMHLLLGRFIVKGATSSKARVLSK